MKPGAIDLNFRLILLRRKIGLILHDVWHHPAKLILVFFIPAKSDCRSRFKHGDCRLWHYSVHGHCKDCSEASCDRVSQPMRNRADWDDQERRSATHGSLVCQTHAKTLLSSTKLAIDLACSRKANCNSNCDGFPLVLLPITSILQHKSFEQVQFDL